MQRHAEPQSKPVSLSSIIVSCVGRLTILNVLAGVAVQPPGINFLHILAHLQGMPQGDSPVGTALRVPSLPGGLTLAAGIALCVQGQARALGLETALLHVVGAQLPWVAVLPITASLLCGVQLPSEEVFFLCQLILCQVLVSPVMRETD